MKSFDYQAAMRRAYRKAGSGLVSVLGRRAPDDVHFYMRLTDSDLERIAAKFGPDATLEFILQMEERRVREKDHAGNR